MKYDFVGKFPNDVQILMRGPKKEIERLLRIFHRNCEKNTSVIIDATATVDPEISEADLADMVQRNLEALFDRKTATEINELRKYPNENSRH